MLWFEWVHVEGLGTTHELTNEVIIGRPGKKFQIFKPYAMEGGS